MNVSKDVLGFDSQRLLTGAGMTTQSAFCTPKQMDLYRQGAIEALSLAEPCEDADLRDAYMAIAEQWRDLANKIERDLKRRPKVRNS